MNPVSRLEFLSAVTGWDYLPEEVELQARRIYTAERLFNHREGFKKEDDTLPLRSLTEPMPDGPAKGNVVPLEEMLPEYYSLRGWDNSGKPTAETMKNLELDQFMDLL
jgi:aldehyde:ferredoxin oxidoreductase